MLRIQSYVRVCVLKRANTGSRRATGGAVRARGKYLVRGRPSGKNRFFPTPLGLWNSKSAAKNQPRAILFMVGDEEKRSKISRAKRVPRGTAQVGLVGCASGHSALFPDKRAHSRSTRICAMSRILFLGCASGHTASWPGWPANGFWTVPPYNRQKWPVGPGWPELKLGLVSCRRQRSGWRRGCPWQGDIGEHGFGTWQRSPRLLAGSSCAGDTLNNSWDFLHLLGSSSPF